MFHLQISPRGRGGGHTPPNRGGRGVRVYDRYSPSTNSPSSSALPTTMESTYPIHEGPSLPLVHEEHAECNVG